MDRQIAYLIAFVLITTLTALNLFRYRSEKTAHARLLYWLALALWVAYALIWFIVLR